MNEISQNTNSQISFVTPMENQNPMSNLSIEGNQFTNLHLPLKHHVLSRLDPHDYGSIAAVNKSFNGVVFSSTENEKVNLSDSYRGFLCLSILKGYDPVAMGVKLFKEFAPKEGINEKFLPAIENKMKNFLEPVQNKIISMAATALFKRKDVLNKELLEMLSFSKNPLFKKMLNLGVEIGANILPQIQDNAKDEEFQSTMKALMADFEEEMESAIIKSQELEDAKELEEAAKQQEEEVLILGAKDTHIVKLNDVLGELKGRVAKVAPTHRVVLPLPPVLPPVMPMAVAPSFFERFKEVVVTTENISTLKNVVLGTAIICMANCIPLFTRVNNTTGV